MLTPGTVLIFISAVLTHAVAGCEWGKYGENCDKRCPPNCQVNPQRNLTHCNKETGECSDGCITGWHAAQCDQPCSKNCLDNVCNHQNGRCTKGCSGKQKGDFCEITEVLPGRDVQIKQGATSALLTTHITVIITLAVVIVIIIVIIVVLFLKFRFLLHVISVVVSGPENPEGLPLIKSDVPPGSSYPAEYPGVMERVMLAMEIIKTEDVFEVTANYKKVKERLEKFRHVTLTGASGDGKTSMALMLGSEYQKKGYELCFVNNITEFKVNTLRQGKDQCFIFDDIFGRVGMSTDSPHLRRILDGLKLRLEQLAYRISERFHTHPHCSSSLSHQMTHMGNIRIIFTTKVYNLEHGKLHLRIHDYVFFKGDSVIDLTQTDCRYTVKEKEQMFRKHKTFNKNNCNFDLSKICHIKDQLFGFPLTCKLFFDFPKSHEQYEQFFIAPLASLKTELEFLLRQRNNKSAALILMLLCEGDLNLCQVEIESNNQAMEDHLLTVSKIVNDFDRSDVAFSVRAFAGTYFTRGDITRFSHPSIYDACAIVLYKFNPGFVLQHCSMRFLYERVQAQTVHACETDEDRHVIYVSDAYNDIIASRLAGAVREGNYRMSIMHPILERQDIVDKVLAAVKPFLTDTSVPDEQGNNVFHYACYSENKYLVQGLIPFCDVNSRAKDGSSPITISARHGMEDVFELLVSRGADFKLHDVCNDTILHIACKGGNMCIVERLLPTSDINLKGQDGRTPVMYAALSGNNNVFELLVSKGADLKLTDDYNDTILHLACQGGHRSIEEYLLQLFDINSQGRNGWTAVKWATVFGKDDVVDLLVSKGADLSMTDDYKNAVPQLPFAGGKRVLRKFIQQPLNIDFLEQHYAPAEITNDICVQNDALDQLCDIDHRDQNGLTGVMKAAELARKDAFDLLVSKGAKLTLTDDDNNTVLHYACIGGNRSIIEYLLPLFDINCRGEHGRISVMTAAVSAKKDAFDLLVSKGADLALTDDYNDTVLNLACEGGNRSIAEYLLSSCDINSPGVCGLTAVMKAAVCAKKDIFDLLVSKGADLRLTARHNMNLLHMSCKGGHADIVEHVLPLFDINCQGYKGWTPVMHGALSGKKDTFDLLLLKGANPSLTGDDNETLLHAASEGGNIDIVRHVFGDFDINTRGWNGHTPLMRAVCGGHTDVVDFLVAHGADVNVVDNDEDGLLHLACGAGNLKMAKHVRSYSDIELRNKFGWTPLTEAAVDGNFAVFKYLKSEGAHLTLFDKTGDDLATLALQGGCRAIRDELGLDVSLRFTPWNRLMKSLVKSKMYCLERYDQKSSDLVQTDQYGNSLLHLACRGGNTQCVEYLLPSYDINVRGQYGWTPVMMAAVCAHYEVFQVLVSQKADLTLVSDKGEHILTLARRGKNDDIVKFLLEET